MEKKLPEIFKKKIINKTNTKVSYIDENKMNNNDKSLSVDEKIRKLFKSSKYVFNIGVIIKTKKKDYDTKIIGKIKRSLITEDNIEIPIVEIEDIIIKDRI